MKLVYDSIIFDLDDTLYKEIDYVRSGFNHIASKLSKTLNMEEKQLSSFLMKKFTANQNPFLSIISNYNLNLNLNDLISIYRNHYPTISLSKGSKKLLQTLSKDNVKLGLLTDGRKIQQMNKINSLNLKKYFDHIIVSEEFGSEKPCINNYLYFSKNAYPSCDNFLYVGDNTKKDFLAPNELGWDSICIKDAGENIHPQNFNISEEYLPKFKVEDILEVINLVYEK